MGFCFNRFLDIFSIHLFERILSNFLVKKGKLFSIRNLSTIPLSSCENHRFTQFLLPLYRCYNFYIGYNIYTIDSFSANASFVQLYVLQSYTRPPHHAQKRVFCHVAGNPGHFGHQPIKIFQERRSSTHNNAFVNNV